MTSFVIANNSQSPQSLAPGEVGVVLAGASLVSEFSSAVVTTGGFLAVAGQVVGNTTAVVCTGETAINLQSTGSMFGQYGIYAQTTAPLSDTISINNDGEIFGSNTAVTLSDHATTLINSGAISGNYGIYYLDSGGPSFFNLANSGSIQGIFGITLVAGVHSFIVNSGTISGTQNALILDEADDRVVNSGLIEGISGLYSGNDLFDGRNGTQGEVSGGDGNDTLSGGIGGDSMLGDAGNDILHGNGGDDTLSGGVGSDLMTGNAGDDSLLADDGNDVVTGGFGDDTVYGGLGVDRIIGGAGDDSLSGDGWNDTILGGDGDDEIYGGAGNDVLTGGRGNDTLNGGSEPDRFVFVRGGGDDVVQAFLNGADKLDMHMLGFANFTAVVAASHNVTGGVFIDLSSLGGGSIVVEALTMALFDASDVLL